MNLYINAFGGFKLIHQIDRKPETDNDLKHVKSMFSRAFVVRKSNGMSGHFTDINLKNWHWYK